MNIGQKLKEARAQAELSQEKVSEEIHVSRQTISNWETEKTYHDESGYEAHMLFCTPKALRYLTIFSEDIAFEDNILLDVLT